MYYACTAFLKENQHPGDVTRDLIVSTKLFAYLMSCKVAKENDLWVTKLFKGESDCTNHEYVYYIECVKYLSTFTQELIE